MPKNKKVILVDKSTTQNTTSVELINSDESLLINLLIQIKLINQKKINALSNDNSKFPNLVTEKSFYESSIHEIIPEFIDYNLTLNILDRVMHALENYNQSFKIENTNRIHSTFIDMMLSYSVNLSISSYSKICIIYRRLLRRNTNFTVNDMLLALIQAKK